MAEHQTEKGKTLLILGGGGILIEPVEYAKQCGYYTIVTDYYKDSPAKKHADEFWDISTADVDLICEKCADKRVDGIFTAFDDFNIRMAAAMAEKLGITFYVTPVLAEETMNKQLFKNNCVKYGVSTVHQYQPDHEGLFHVSFPVIVKPVDSSGSRGITVCQTEHEFNNAVDIAKKLSRSGDIIVEDYLEGDEVGINYLIQDGRIVLSASHDRYLQPYKDETVRLPQAYVYPSKHQKAYIDSGNQSVVNMFEQMGLKNGSLFMQGCVQDGIVLFYEMGYRLNAAKQYQIIENECSVNPMHALIEHTMRGSMSETDLCELINPLFKKRYCTLSLAINPGIISAIDGLDIIKSREEVLDVTQWCFEGDELPISARGTQKLIAARVTLACESLEALAKSIDFVNANFSVTDSFGNDMRDGAFDTSRLFE